MRPEPVLTVSEWADAHRVLSTKAASEAGPWRTDRTPYLREIMDALSATSPVQRVVFQKGAQIGATEAGVNWVGYVVHHAPGPMLVVWPTVDMGRRNSKQRIASLISESPVLRGLVSEGQKSGNTLLSKEFPGGILVITGANSSVGLRSMPVRFLFLDECDAYPGDVDGEGDPIALAETRTRTFRQRRKVFIPSTPTIAGRSRIEREYGRSDQRRYFVPCPHCDAFQWLQFRQLKWPKGEPAKAEYECEECSGRIGEQHKTEMLRRGVWRSTGKGDGKTVGFHLSSLYSPVGWMSWAEIAEKWIAAQGDPELMKEFVNTVLGETWQARGDAPEWQDVYRRRETYRSATVPRGAVVLFAGVDVQKDRLEVGVWGYGRNRERWLIEHRQLMGATDRPDVWASLAAMLGETWPHETGAEMSVRDWGVDSGAFGPEVGAFVRSQQGRGNVWAVDGRDVYTSAYLGIGQMEFTVRGAKVKHGLRTLKIGVSFCKQELVGQLGLDQPEDPTKPLPGTVHLPNDVGEEACKQLASESLMSRREGGRVKREWVVIEGRRNEVLDCANYARGLAAMRGWDRWKESRFAELESLLSDSAAGIGGNVAPVPAPDLAPALQAALQRQQSTREPWLGGRQNGWLGPRG